VVTRIKAGLRGRLDDVRGVGKSGSPAPKPITGSPAAFIALALASTASVALGASPASRSLTLEVIAFGSVHFP